MSLRQQVPAARVDRDRPAVKAAIVQRPATVVLPGGWLVAVLAVAAALAEAAAAAAAEPQVALPLRSTMLGLAPRA